MRARIRLFGQVHSAQYPVWIEKHAHKLGVRVLCATPHADCLEIDAEGPEDLVTALALGCSLGPHSVLVERTEIVALG